MHIISRYLKPHCPVTLIFHLPCALSDENIEFILLTGFMVVAKEVYLLLIGELSALSSNIVIRLSFAQLVI